jgi:hypothetical protein
VERLERDWERLVSRLRTSAAKRFKRVGNATALIWKLLLVERDAT